MAAAVAATVGLTGCASTWDTMTSRRFRDAPFGTMFKSDDPMAVLRENPDGEARARAMRDLKEPAAEPEQTEAIEILAAAATGDPSPWVRVAAIDALGRFRDPRAVEHLAHAYHQAGGKPPAQQDKAPGLLNDRLGLHGPQGFPSDQAANIRGRAIEALAKTGRPEAVGFLAEVASTPTTEFEDPIERNAVRQRAVAGLAKIRDKEAVAALAKVLAAEQGKDVTLTNLAHGGLVELTGLKHPADPAAWNEVVQAGFEIAPEPSGLRRALGTDDTP
jgi:HEAT repeat protein